jgi:hypothetical protein
LRIGNTGICNRGVAEEHILKLVHPGIGEHKAGIVLYHHRCRRNDLMFFGPEKIQEYIAYFIGIQHINVKKRLFFPCKFTLFNYICAVYIGEIA